MSNLILIIPIGSLLVLLAVLHFRYKYKLKNFTGELEQEHQQNINLKRNLAQAEQKAVSLSNELKEIKSNFRQIVGPREAHLSRENERLSNELNQERRRNVNIKNKLAVSNSSLDQFRQHNERLTGELTQANQHNKHLTNNLKQKREDKAKLERQLVNLNRSAYQTILEAIYSENRAKTDTQKQTYLQKLRNSATELWNEYRGADISPDYSRTDYQEAYLLCYFLPYAQPVPYLLNRLILKKNFSYQLPEKELLTASFFGCGPGPEIFGLMRYLGSYQPSISISAAMLDREPWKHGRKIVRQLLDRIWNPDLYNIREFNADIVGSPNDFLPADSEKWVKSSDLIVIQHCLNERHNAKSERLVENMKQLVEKMKTGAVMLIIERSTYVQEFLKRFRHVLQKEFSNSVDFSDNINGEKIKPLLEVIPKELATNFLIDQPSNSVNSVEFIWIAICKK